MIFFKKKTISGVTVKLPREELLRRSRILVIDDERPDLIDDLKAARFSVDYEPDIVKTNLDLLEKQIYDLILLDFGGVGKEFGDDEGLSLLKHIKRINPAVIVLAYTSKALTTQHSDFYRLSDGVLAKDAGIQESLEKIESALRLAHNLENVWRGLLKVCDVRIGSSEDREWQDLFVVGMNQASKMEKLKKKITESLQSESAEKLGKLLLSKLVEIGVKGVIG